VTTARTEALWPRVPPKRLREELQHDDSDDLARRRAVILLSLAGMAGMAAVTALQTGIIRHLPDPPGPFDSDKVNSSETAYRWGLPDGPIALASLGLNVALAALGEPDRARKQPWIPLAAAVKAGVEAAAASWYFYQMPAKEKAWCPYCIGGALANIGIAAATVPEARRAWRELRRHR